MSTLDWIFLSATLAFIILYGIFKNRKNTNLDGFFLGNKSLPWYNVGLSVMATQASAITFLSAPGQAFTDGMGFIQFYFGLPLAMVVLSITFIPIFNRLKVFTAYEYLEGRFDGRVRVFTAMLFLLQRGLSTGISIYAPSIILSTIFGWDIFWTNAFMGGTVLTYTLIGGTKAISHTHIQQMIIVTAAMVFAGIMVVQLLPADIGVMDAVKVAGKAGKVNLINLEFNPKEKYNVWSGILAGFFLQLSYFGTDQSQVGRYLTAKNTTQSRLGLLFNGLLKIPMQFGILFIGVLVFVFYQFNTSPLFFNQVETDKLLNSQYANEYRALELEHQANAEIKKVEIYKLHEAIQSEDEVQISLAQEAIQIGEDKFKALKAKVSDLIKKNNPEGDAGDINYIFIRFILDHLPHGFIGLLIAVIFSASMGSVASAYNSLAACTVIDVLKKTKSWNHSESKELMISKLITVFWAIFCIIVAFFANKLGSSMIELVNVLGSWFYGIILGIFLVAFYYKKIGGQAIFYSAVISQVLIILIWKFELVAYLWLNPIGCILVFSFGWVFQQILNLRK
ncbi:sodium:solute symporter [Arcticibacterium luteifluviistationis]|uniref:Sodium:solute symporter n=1 Tax=Arcticibacterium luteifluviistationis TaxID=1784714 RepID=A0A2Z4G6Z5_9BACT|nr:sodium:solute symporter [Arcticibacterium luteifluviistationis]AWV96932.1 sodium:solute symporter [Arcticibacterium luteifluviistationis]